VLINKINVFFNVDKLLDTYDNIYTYGPLEQSLLEQLGKISETIDICLRNNFDTGTSILSLEKLIDSTNIYLSQSYVLIKAGLAQKINKNVFIFMFLK
jgi:hypothetical protein